MTTVKLIGDLPAGPNSLVGTELVEIQNGGGPGASQQTTAALIAQIALRQAVQALVAGTGDIHIDVTDPNHPIVSVPKPQAGTNIAIDHTDPLNPIITSTTPVAGGIQAAYGSPGGAVLQVANSVSGIATAHYTLTGWEIQCSPSGSIALDLLVGPLGSNPTSIIGNLGNAPSVNSSTYNSANALSGWTSVDVPRGSVIQVVVKSVTAVEWFSVAFLGNRI